MFKPRRHKVAIEPLHDPDYYNPATKNIIIPESAKERSDQGIVKYLGADVSDDIKIGDHVIFSGYTGTTIAIDDELLIEIHQDFIKGVIEVEEDQTVSGLFFMQKLDAAQVWAMIQELKNIPSNQDLFDLLQKYEEKRIIPAPYPEAAKALAYAHKEISERVKIKADYHQTQRDPIDERNR